MTKHKRDAKRRSSRIDRIERKCDRILSELLLIRQWHSFRSDMDMTIERLHNAARYMRVQCERERDCANRMFHSKHPE